MPVPILCHPKDSRIENITVTIPGTGVPSREQELVLNDIVEVTIKAAETAIRTENWRLGYALTIHACQGLTIRSPQKVWIIDKYLQWPNLAYVEVSPVEYMDQLERVTRPPEEGSA